MATYTASTADALIPARISSYGMVVAAGNYVANGVTFSTSDVVQMIRVPTGARIVDGYIRGQVLNTAGVTVKVGDGGNDSRFGTFSLSNTSSLNRFTSGQLYQYSLSDDAVPLIDTIDITMSAGTVTATCSIDVVVIYAMPGVI